jgi:hypothetical protein
MTAADAPLDPARIADLLAATVDTIVAELAGRGDQAGITSVSSLP